MYKLQNHPPSLNKSWRCLNRACDSGILRLISSSGTMDTAMTFSCGYGLGNKNRRSGFFLGTNKMWKYEKNRLRNRKSDYEIQTFWLELEKNLWCQVTGESSLWEVFDGGSTLSVVSSLSSNIGCWGKIGLSKGKICRKKTFLKCNVFSLLFPEYSGN